LKEKSQEGAEYTPNKPKANKKAEKRMQGIKRQMWV
jgi:hypothetical protein